MHQYHLGSDEEERDGELVVSKVFFQTQPRQCGSATAKEPALAAAHSNAIAGHQGGSVMREANAADQFYSSSMIRYGQGIPSNGPPAAAHFMPNLAVHAGRVSYGP
uniref:Uncharacterized protein n=1 Tax=Arundo donax TaxID=35708 RepID=A0A0A9FB53_ARUDO